MSKKTGMVVGYKLKMRRLTLGVRCVKLLSAYSEAWRGTPRFYEVNKLIRKLWEMNP